MSKNIESKIKDKYSKEFTSIENVLDCICEKMQENDAIQYKAYWTKILMHYTNVLFMTELTDDSQMYRLKWCNIADSEIVTNIDYIARIVALEKENGVKTMYKPCHVETRDDRRYCNGLPLIVTDVEGKPQGTNNDNYPVMIANMPDRTYIVIDGNHRVVNGETEAIIISPRLFIQSIISLYEVFMFLMDVDWNKYMRGETIDEIVTYNEKVITLIKQIRKI